ncbi:MAG TPA: YCF48-related protein [Duganella sp.]|nr:YCF48-related protein [Duganella sp.]
MFDLHFYDADHGVVVGAYNLAFSTADGGRTWQSLMGGTSNPQALHLYALRAHGDTLLVAGEQGLALRSDDRGRSFRKLAVPYKGSFFTAEILDAAARDMMLAGLRGNVWRSRDGGDSWTQWSTPIPVSITGSALVAEAAGSSSMPAVVLVNQAGQILRSDGDTLKLQPGAPLAPLAGVIPLKEGGMLALGMAGPVRIAAGGGAK